MQKVLVAQALDALHPSAQRRARSLHELHMLRTHAHGVHCSGQGRLAQCGAGQQVDAWRAQAAGHSHGVRVFVNLLWRAELHHAPVVEHADAVGQRERLDLVVGDIEHGGAGVLLYALEFQTQVIAQLGVQ